MGLLEATIAAIGPLNEESMQRARARQGQLTKPPGSLGRLESLSVQLAGITEQLQPSLQRKRIFVCAGDHGVTAEGISAFPAEVTPQMVLNFLNGGAAINVLARLIGADVTVVDLGVNADLPEHSQLFNRKIACGTGNIVREPAMRLDQARKAVETGITLIHHFADAPGLDLAITGDMGIGNTTPSAAIVAAVTGQPVSEVTGRGTGVDEHRFAHKISIVQSALATNRPDPHDGLDILAKVGGFEIGGIAGIILGAAAHHVPVLVDGFIATAGALIAALLSPQSKACMIAGHCSQETGHRVALAHLDLEPVLDLDLRLGEGTGATLAVPIVEAAVKILNEMATFADAGVSQKEGE